MNRFFSKKIRKVLTIALSAFIAVSSIAGAISVSAESQTFALGNMTCVLDDEGTLTVTGEGQMSTVSKTKLPWKSGTCDASSIKKIIVSDGITLVRNFWDLTDVTYIEVPSSVTTIGANAFSGCSNPDLVIDIKGQLTSVNATKPFDGVVGKIYVYDTNSRDLVSARIKEPATVELKVSTEGLKETLRQYIETTKNQYKQEEYTPESYAVLSKALSAAEEAAAKSDATADDIQTATKGIEDAVKQLVTVIDGLKKELNDAITSAKKMDKAAYTVSSVAALTKAIEEAEAAYKKDPADKDELTKAKTALETASAIDETGLAETGLKKKADSNHTQELNVAINLAEPSEKYTAESYVAYQAAIDKAKELNNKYDDITNEQIEAVLAEINQAKGKLVEKKADLALEKYNEAKQAVLDILNDENSPYTKNSLDEVRRVFDYQVGRVEDEEGNIIADRQSIVDNAATVLSSVTDNLVEKGDLTALNALIDSTNELVEANYTDETWSALSQKIVAANTLIADPDNAAKADVEEAEQALRNAIETLAYKSADYTAVDEAIQKVPVDMSVYTEETATAVTAAVEAVDRTKNITEQDIVDGYAKAIEDAIAALVEKPTEEPTEEPTEVPTDEPTEEPTEAPTDEQTEEPTETPTDELTEEPTEASTDEPSDEPTEVPTDGSSEKPTEAPTDAASATEAPSTTAPSTTAPSGNNTGVGAVATDKPVNTGAQTAVGLSAFMAAAAIGLVALKKRNK